MWHVHEIIQLNEVRFSNSNYYNIGKWLFVTILRGFYFYIICPSYY